MGQDVYYGIVLDIVYDVGVPVCTPPLRVIKRVQPSNYVVDRMFSAKPYQWIVGGPLLPGPVVYIHFCFV